MKELIINLIQKALKEEKIDLEKKEIENLLEIPPSVDLGDFSFPCFSLANKLKREPTQIALEIRENIGNLPIELDDVQTVGPYVNFFANRGDFARKVIFDIRKKEDNFGKIKLGKQKTMVEFSQPNTHKAFHVGHIRGTSLGESLARISEFCGNKVVRANYQGDTGMHVAKWLWCYTKYHSREKIKKDESWIASIYVDAVKRLTRNEKLQKEVDAINQTLGTREDKKLNELWEKTRKYSLDSLEKIYKELNTHFDVYFFESEQEKKGLKIVDDLLKRKIAKISEGAVIINLKKYKLGVWVLLRKDKTILYSAKDLALAQEKFKKFKLNKSIYVIGAEQSLHMAQLFKTLELIGFEHFKDCIHVVYSEVRFPNGKMSSRTGKNLLYSDFLEEVINYSKKEIKKRYTNLSKKKLEERALKIAIAAIKYSMLKQTPNKNIIFKKEDALNFDGDTGPYIQYSYARASSILRKIKQEPKNFNVAKVEDKEMQLVKKLSQFPEIVFNSFQSLNPALIANYSYQLAQIFNEFYHQCPVISSKDKKEFRVSLVNSFRQVLRNAFYLLGIDVIEEM